MSVPVKRPGSKCKGLRKIRLRVISQVLCCRKSFCRIRAETSETVILCFWLWKGVRNGGGGQSDAFEQIWDSCSRWCCTCWHDGFSFKTRCYWQELICKKNVSTPIRLRFSLQPDDSVCYTVISCFACFAPRGFWHTNISPDFDWLKADAKSQPRWYEGEEGVGEGLYGREKKKRGGICWDMICLLFISLTPGDSAALPHVISHTSCRAPGARNTCGGAAHQEDSAAKTKRSRMTQVPHNFEMLFFFSALRPEIWQPPCC